MVRRPKAGRKGKHYRKLPPISLQKSHSLTILDSFTIKDIIEFDRIKDLFLEFELNFYSDFANQRSKIYDQLQSALSQYSTSLNFKNWQRVVGLKWVLHPLSSKGSLKDPGGRFNIGDIDPNKFPTFPALYIACDKDTALQETLGQAPLGSKLSNLELALTNPSSIGIISLSGNLENIFDLTNKKNLGSFADIIKDFKVSEHILEMTKTLIEKGLGVNTPKAIKDVEELYKSLLEENWREKPMQFDIPANSQIFGQIASSAGIEAILYPSKITGKDCLAVFPRNFENSYSYIELDDPSPPECPVTRLDNSTWGKLI